MTLHDLKLAPADSAQSIDAAMQAVESAMYNVVNSDIEVLRDASRHILQAGGKRVRPRLSILTYLACGGTDLEYAAAPAAAVELMHTASVVHDDINDHGVVRRGRPSVNAIWGRTFALLTGDFLFTAVYQLMAPYGSLNKILADAATALVEGETLQAYSVKNNQFTRENYIRIISLKTAALFRSATELGALLAGANDTTVKAMADYGYNIGLAFQIVDDILDIVGDETTLGKTSGIDLAQGRGFAAVNDAAADMFDTIKQKMLSGNRLEEARAQALALSEMAIMQLDVLPDSAARTELIDIAHKVVNRDH
jgi:octaprenyl-diphosphate synthase